MIQAVAPDLQTRAINTIRGLSMDAVQRANSGHPGMPMGAAVMAYALWTRHLRHNPRNPKWFNRDRFVLSAGHGSMLLYSLLHLTGYDLSLEDLKSFRSLESKTPGHPENFATPGVEMATGPLGQGFATSVGMAIAERFLAATFNRPGYELINHFSYGICSDGDLMEGISNEAASLAGHLGLGKLIYLYDSNGITIDGRTDLAFTEDTSARFRALGWQVIDVDGMDVDAVDRAIVEAKEDSERPSLIVCRTIIGYGSPNKADSSKSHGAALGINEVKLAKERLGIPLEPEFDVPDDVRTAFRTAIDRGAAVETDWEHQLIDYRRAHPDVAGLFDDALSGADVARAVSLLPTSCDAMATRVASGKAINAIQLHLPTLVGGSADLAESNNTTLHGLGDFQSDNPAGRNINFGVREHAMAAAVNGITLHGGCHAFGGSFLIFSDYARPSIRLAALMGCPSIFVFTHDSIGLGEDGPTHQPIEHLASLRAIPNLDLLRPADANETSVCWRLALTSSDHPSLVALSRQSLPAVTPQVGEGHPAERGAYVLKEASSSAKVALVATGSEVHLALKAAEQLEVQGVPTRVVSMPSWFQFERQPLDYRREVLPKNLPTVSIEAASPFGWEKYAQAHIAMEGFGASAPAAELFPHFGFTPERIVEVAKDLILG